MSGVGQPDTLPSHRLRVDGVVCIESGGAYAASNIITAPGNFSLRTEFGFDGNLDNMIVGDQFVIEHHWQRIEDGATGLLPVSPAIAVPAALSHIQQTSGPYTTGGAGNLPIPPGFTSATYRIFTHIRFLAPNQHTHAGFDDGLIILVVA